jgi:hypothetical protein
MGEIKVTTATGEVESKNLDPAMLLKTIREELGALMEAGDVFLDKKHKPVAVEQETKTKLRDIVVNSAITIARGQATGDVVDDDGDPVVDDDGDGDDEDSAGTKDPDNAGSLGGDGRLTPKVLPEAVWAADHVGLETGFLVSGDPVQGDDVTRMKVGQVRNLLKANRIDLNKEGFGTAPGLVNSIEGFNWSPHDGVRLAEVEVKSPIPNKRYTSISFQYSERISRLHRAAATSGEANVGVPGIFDVQGSYQTESATRADTRTVKEHKSFSHLIPKARVVIKKNKISLSQEFIDEIKDAVKKPQPAPALLDVLAEYGEFFPADVLLGGRLDYWTAKKLSELYTEQQDSDGFRLAAKAKAQIDGVPVEGGANWAMGISSEKKQTAIDQASTLDFKMKGGNPVTVTAEDWVPTLAKYMNWEVAGFNQRSLVPTIQYLDEKLRSKCIGILRDYFTRHLQFASTMKAGVTDRDPFGEDVGDVKRIVQIDVNHGKNIDGLKVTYELTNGKREVKTSVGGRRGEYNDIIGPLDFDEEISSIEAGISKESRTRLRRLAFNTTKGKRFPPSKNDYYGRVENNEVDHFTIEAPRVCGIVGNVGSMIDSIGLRYRELSLGAKSRDFLLEIEPYLFPMNIPPRIEEMTVKGILLAANWKTKAELTDDPGITLDAWRNELIIALGAHSNQDGNFYWGKNNDELVGFGAIVMCLLQTRIHVRKWLQQYSCAEHRKALIDRIQERAPDEKREALERLSDGELVRWGFSMMESR